MRNSNLPSFGGPRPYVLHAYLCHTVFCDRSSLADPSRAFPRSVQASLSVRRLTVMFANTVHPSGGQLPYMQTDASSSRLFATASDLRSDSTTTTTSSFSPSPRQPNLELSVGGAPPIYFRDPCRLDKGVPSDLCPLPRPHPHRACPSGQPPSDVFGIPKASPYWLYNRQHTVIGTDRLID